MMKYPVKAIISDLENDVSDMVFYFTRSEAQSNPTHAFQQQLMCKSSGSACYCGRCNYNPALDQ